MTLPQPSLETNPAAQPGLELGAYESALAQLAQEGKNPSSDTILAVLLARDAVEKALKAASQPASADLLKLFQLDQLLAAQSQAVRSQVDLDRWRASREPPREAWWWSLPLTDLKGSRFDWLWGGLAVVLFALSLSLLVDMAARFFSGGPDLSGALLVISQSLLAILAAGTSLTRSGQELIDKGLEGLNIPRRYWATIRVGFSALTLLLLLAFYRTLPQVAMTYNNRGWYAYQAGLYETAKGDYLRAIRLYPDYAEAHYNLGRIYEDFHELDAAKIEYRIAAEAGLPEAENNLGRLYLLEGEYAQAVVLLQRGLEHDPGSSTRYALLKNLGWARIGQERFLEAESTLGAAVSLAPEKGAAHCLLAQALEKTRASEAQVEWGECLKYANGREPDEDQWIFLARQRLTKEAP